MAALPFTVFETQQSFSSLVDQALRSTGQVGQLTNAVSYANATIRENQKRILPAQDLVEDSFTSTSNSPIWDVPPVFRSMRTVQYISGYGQAWPDYVPPGKAQNSRDKFFYYRANDYFVFDSAGEQTIINLAYYRWAPRYRYYRDINQILPQFSDIPIRLAYYDGSPGFQKWQYLNSTNNGYVDTLGNPTLEQAYREASSHWLILEWYDLILEGVKNKLLSTARDSDGAGPSYSLYKSMQKDMEQTVLSASENF